LITKDDIMLNLYTSLKEKEVPLEVISEIVKDIFGGLKSEYGVRKRGTEDNN
jgi:hypothetical protein